MTSSSWNVCITLWKINNAMCAKMWHTNYGQAEMISHQPVNCNGVNLWNDVQRCRCYTQIRKSTRSDFTYFTQCLFWYQEWQSLHPLYYLSVAWQSKLLNTFFLYILYSKKVYDFRCSLCVSMSHIRKLECIQQSYCCGLVSLNALLHFKESLENLNVFMI